MTYPGGKAGAGVCARLINQIPPHQTFISAFLGDCAVLKAIRPAQQSIGIDLDTAAILTWKTRQIPNLTLYRADATALLTHLFALEAWPRQPNYPQKPLEPFVYCDPPYPLSTRSRARMYQHELTDQQHEALLVVLLRLPCPVMISTYPNPLYQDLLQSWRLITYDAMTRGGTTRREAVYMNYPQPTTLHDYSHAGNNKRQRERIHRRARTWRRILTHLPAIERGAVLQHLADLSATIHLGTANPQNLPPDDTANGGRNSAAVNL